jgi:hypothetical protein
MLQTCPDGGIQVPGSATCLRLGGQLRTETTVVGGSGGEAFRHTLTRRSGSGRVTVDVRTPTPLGPIRAFASVRGGLDGPPGTR